MTVNGLSIKMTRNAFTPSYTRAKAPPCLVYFLFLFLHSLLSSSFAVFACSIEFSSFFPFLPFSSLAFFIFFLIIFLRWCLNVLIGTGKHVLKIHFISFFSFFLQKNRSSSKFCGWAKRFSFGTGWCCTIRMCRHRQSSSFSVLDKRGKPNFNVSRQQVRTFHCHIRRCIDC